MLLRPPQVVMIPKLKAGEYDVDLEASSMVRHSERIADSRTALSDGQLEMQYRALSDHVGSLIMVEPDSGAASASSGMVGESFASYEQRAGRAPFGGAATQSQQQLDGGGGAAADGDGDGGGLSSGSDIACTFGMPTLRPQRRPRSFFCFAFKANWSEPCPLW
jgi:hypothetical protein